MEWGRKADRHEFQENVCPESCTSVVSSSNDGKHQLSLYFSYYV